jgi:hypothetical protein
MVSEYWFLLTPGEAEHEDGGADEHADHQVAPRPVRLQRRRELHERVRLLLPLGDLH